GRRVLWLVGGVPARFRGPERVVDRQGGDGERAGHRGAADPGPVHRARCRRRPHPRPGEHVDQVEGEAGVNPAYAVVAVFLILAWRNAGYLGLDGLAVPMARERLHRGRPVTGLPEA